MILLDTSVWIEFLRQRETYAREVSMLLRSRLVVAFEPVFAELLLGVRNNREKQIILDYWNALPKLASQEGYLLASAHFANEQKYHSKGIGMMDAAIIRATMDGNLQLWTLDKSVLSVLESRFIYK